MVTKSPLLTEVRVCIDDKFDEFKELNDLIMVAKRVDIGLYMTETDFYNSDQFNDWAKNAKVNLRVCDAVVQKGGYSLEKVRGMKISHLKMFTDFETLPTFQGVKKVSLEKLPPPKYKLRAPKSLKTVNCLAMPPIKPINFSFRKLEHIREITILTHISKHSFDSPNI
ncbi:unnamed protein product [Ambrosiozyma monospora]|uniref:Unnamed protein product n=1 Tax=Ambrosiozyma monospora TaxID=43982 RepID=A0ACB5U8M9_AMBMO|nr:unnamed protein product [Ambrosiozyma monospora]